MSAGATRGILYLVLVGLAGVVVLGYGVFEARKILAGPELTLTSPEEGSATSSPLVTIAGTAQNIAFLSINNKQAYTNVHGQFLETLSPPPGYTVITVSAKDRFGREVTRVVHFSVVTYCPIS